VIRRLHAAGAEPRKGRSSFQILLGGISGAAVFGGSSAGLVPVSLIHRLTATVAKGRDDDWAGFAREVSENAGL